MFVKCKNCLPKEGIEIPDFYQAQKRYGHICNDNPK